VKGANALPGRVEVVSMVCSRQLGVVVRKGGIGKGEDGWVISQKWPEMRAYQESVVGNAINGRDGLAHVLGKLEGAVVGDWVGTKDDGRVGVSDVRMQHAGEALHEVRIASEKRREGER
jgi:hypothetical protein